MKEVPQKVSINTWLLFAGTGATVESTVRQKDRQAVHTGLLRDIIPRMVNATEQKKVQGPKGYFQYHTLALTGLFASFSHSQAEGKDLKN